MKYLFLLSIVFVVLKLAGVIAAWPWWLVVLPALIGAALGLLFLAVWIAVVSEPGWSA